MSFAGELSGELSGDLAGNLAAGSLTPRTIFGSALSVWLKYDAGITIGTGVSQWSDQSGSANHVTQGTGANQPAFTNGELVFDGSNDALFTPAFANINNAPTANHYAMHIVGRMTALGAKAGPQRFAWLNALALASGVNTAANDWEVANSTGTAAAGAPDTSLHLVSNYVTANGAGGLAMAVDGTVIATGTAAVSGSAGGFLLVGAGSGAVVLTPCAIREIVISYGITTPAQLAALKAYFRGRYPTLAIA
jgi:hypothetical protein